MFQDVLALSIVFAAIIYLIYSVYKIVRPIKTTNQPICGGCSASGCGSKSKFSRTSH